MTEMIEGMRVITKSSLPKIQKGIILSNSALKFLYVDLEAKLNLDYVPTYRLNQDVLENFFVSIREKGGDQPDRLQFKYRMIPFILGRNKGVLSNTANVSEDDTPDLDMIPHTLAGYPSDVKWGEWHEEIPLDGIEYDGLENFAS